MSAETKKKLLKRIEEYRAKAREYKDGSAKRAMYIAYADGIRSAIFEIEREDGHDAE